MEFIWTIPLFILPIVTLIFVIKGIGEFKKEKKTKRLKLSVLIFAVTAIYYFIVFSIQADTTKYYEQKLSGQFRKTDSTRVFLNLLPYHAFTLDNKIDDKFYGDGNWEINLDAFVLLTLDFENGETLTLKYLPRDSILIGANELTEKIIFQKIANND